MVPRAQSRISLSIELEQEWCGWSRALTPAAELMEQIVRGAAGKKGNVIYGWEIIHCTAGERWGNHRWRCTERIIGMAQKSHFISGCFLLELIPGFETGCGMSLFEKEKGSRYRRIE